MEFPYGKAPLAILVLALLTGLAMTYANLTEQAQPRPDLVFATFTKEHAATYQKPIAEFEKLHGVKVQLQVVSQRALQGRLQSAMQAGAEVPDMVELLYGTLGFFTRGPLEDIGFVDLTDRVREAGLFDSLVRSRFSLWSTRGRIFALPHDVHPVMLAYRRDLIEQLGIDVNKLTTWGEFSRVGREITRDLNGDGVRDRYMLDLPADGGDSLRLLLSQRGGGVFDDKGNVIFDSEEAVEVLCWYVRQIRGSGQISTACGWGQTLSRAMIDGLCLFYICPDWRTRQIEVDIPSLKGKMAVMPLPAWTEGGRRTSTWGGAGLAITRQSKNPELAWKLAMYLYYDPSQLGQRFEGTNIIPPLKAAWNLPEFSKPNPFWGGELIGRRYAELAPSTPAEQSNPYMSLAGGKLSEAFTNTSLHYKEHGEAGLEDFARSELKRCAARVREVMKRNVFMKDSEVTMTSIQSPLPGDEGTNQGRTP